MTTIRPERPAPTAGLRHVALFVTKLETCADFYTRLLGMQIDWQPDPDNIYLTSGHDNLALHRAPPAFNPAKHQRLDHIGFFIKKREDVDLWHAWLLAEGADIRALPRDHRDGTRSFYCADPDGNIVQLIHIPSAK